MQFVGILVAMVSVYCISDVREILHADDRSCPCYSVEYHRLKNQKRKYKKLAGIDWCCDLLDPRLDDLDPAGGVDGLDCLEEIP